MRDGPDSAELLEVARARLMEELLPALPPENKYSALMIAAAMAIAIRELKNGDAPQTEERDMLCKLLGVGDPADVSMLDLNRRFAAGLRGGEFDPATPGHESALRVLRHATLSNLRESNPKYLRKAD
jgi:uncharacterized protein DUF6285